MHYKIKELHKLITILKNEEGLSDIGESLLEGYALSLESFIKDDKKTPTNKYKYCNHHHKIDDKHEIVNIGGNKFVANKEAIPLLTSLNDAGLKTRTHHISDTDKWAFVSLLLDNIEYEVKEIYERDSNRTKYNGKKELLIRWHKSHSNNS